MAIMCPLVLQISMGQVNIIYYFRLATTPLRPQIKVQLIYFLSYTTV